MDTAWETSVTLPMTCMPHTAIRGGRLDWGAVSGLARPMHIFKRVVVNSMVLLPVSAGLEKPVVFHAGVASWCGGAGWDDAPTQ